MPLHEWESLNISLNLCSPMVARLSSQLLSLATGCESGNLESRWPVGVPILVLQDPICPTRFEADIFEARADDLARLLGCAAGPPIAASGHRAW
jgi:hypothetical protein